MEENLRQYEENEMPPGNEEVVLTETDKERFFSLMRQLDEFEQYAWLDTGFYELGPTENSVSLRKVLREENGKAAQYIFDAMRSESFDGDMLKYLRRLDFCVSPEHAEELGAMLESKKVQDNTDRSVKTKILDILQRVGTPATIPRIVRFAENSFDTPYERFTDFERARNFRDYDNFDAWRTVLAIERRAAEEGFLDESTNQLIKDAKERINGGLESRGYNRCDREQDQWVWESADPVVIRRDFEELFSDVPQEEDLSIRDGNDFAIQDEYESGQLQALESRLETVKRLRYEVKKENAIEEESEDDEGKFLRRHWLEYREKNYSRYTPTLGIEIEIREQTVFSPEELKEMRDLEENDYHKYAARIREKRRSYLKTEELGVPAGRDKFWEFANAPARYYLTLSREVQALIEMGLINKTYPRHPMHLTIGGISIGKSAKDIQGVGFDIEENRMEQVNQRMLDEEKEVFVFARALDATAWCTTGGRLTRPYLTKKLTYGWTIKGVGGVKERPPEEIKLDTKKAVELRTFQLQSISGLDRLLRSSFLLGAALKAYQKVAQEKMPTVGDPVEIDLARTWERFSFDCRELFQRYDLPDPHGAWAVPLWNDSPRMKKNNAFARLGRIIDKARAYPKSNSAQFVKQMRELIIETRANVIRVMGEEKG